MKGAGRFKLGIDIGNTQDGNGGLAGKRGLDGQAHGDEKVLVM